MEDEDFLLFFFFLGLTGGAMDFGAGFSLAATLERCGGGVGRDLCAGGVVMAKPGTLSLDRHCGHTTTPRVSLSCSVENSTRLLQFGQVQVNENFF